MLQQLKGHRHEALFLPTVHKGLRTLTPQQIIELTDSRGRQVEDAGRNARDCRRCGAGDSTDGIGFGRGFKGRSLLRKSAHLLRADRARSSRCHRPNVWLPLQPEGIQQGSLVPHASFVAHRMTGKIEQDRAAIPIISQVAQETGLAYYDIADILRRTGDIDELSLRLCSAATDPLARLGQSKASILAEAEHLQTECGNRAATLPDEARRLADILAVQKKLIRALCAGRIDGLEAGALAISYERACVELEAHGTSRAMLRRLAVAAARGSDRAVLLRRNSNFRELVAEVASASGTPFAKSAIGLMRCAQIDADDERLALVPEEIGRLNALGTADYMQRLRAASREGVERVRRKTSPAATPAAIRRDLEARPKPPNQPEAKHGISARHATFMEGSARVLERIALNLMQTSPRENQKRISNLIAIAASACDRAQAYRTREREAQSEIALAAPRTRERGYTM